jgi:hypothetical protein
VKLLLDSTLTGMIKKLLWGPCLWGEGVPTINNSSYIQLTLYIYTHTHTVI